MSNLREAAQQALEALDEAATFHRNLPDQHARRLAAMTALRAALAEPEPQEIADLRQACQEGWRYADELDQERKRLEEALRAALAEPVEPVAWMFVDDTGMKFVSVDQPHKHCQPLYAAPPQRKED